MKQIILILVFVFFTFGVFSQRLRKQIELNHKYTVSKIFLIDNTFKKVRNLTISDIGIVSFNENSGKSVKIPYIELRIVKIKTGTHALRYGVFGAGFMALSSLYTAVEISKYPWLESSENANNIYAGLILSGGILGGIVGALVPKWETFTLPEISKNKSSSFEICPVFNPNNKQISLTINFNF